MEYRQRPLWTQSGQLPSPQAVDARFSYFCGEALALGLSSNTPARLSPLVCRRSERERVRGAASEDAPSLFRSLLERLQEGPDDEGRPMRTSYGPRGAPGARCAAGLAVAWRQPFLMRLVSSVTWL